MKFSYKGISIRCRLFKSIVLKMLYVSQMHSFWIGQVCQRVLSGQLLGHIHQNGSDCTDLLCF